MFLLQENGIQSLRRDRWLLVLKTDRIGARVIQAQYLPLDLEDANVDRVSIVGEAAEKELVVTYVRELQRIGSSLIRVHGLSRYLSLTMCNTARMQQVGPMGLNMLPVAVNLRFLLTYSD